MSRTERDRCLVRQTTLDRPRWRCTTTFPHARLGAPHNDHAEPRRDDVELLAHLLADPMQRLAAARAGIVTLIAQKNNGARKVSPAPAWMQNALGLLRGLGQRERFAVAAHPAQDRAGPDLVLGKELEEFAAIGTL
jgi:hypothetical protein